MFDVALTPITLKICMLGSHAFTFTRPFTFFFKLFDQGNCILMCIYYKRFKKNDCTKQQKLES